MPLLTFLAVTLSDACCSVCLLPAAIDSASRQLRAVGLLKCSSVVHRFLGVASLDACAFIFSELSIG